MVFLKVQNYYSYCLHIHLGAGLVGAKILSMVPIDDAGDKNR